VVHGLVHLIGSAKAFGVADIPQLTQQIARLLGILWLLAAALFLLAAILLFTRPQLWWVVGAGAIVVSQVVILTSWSDAPYGTIANIVALLGVTLGFLSQGPSSFRAEYGREIAQGLGRAVPMPLLTEGDLAQLPTPVQRYIRLNGAVGQPRVQNFRARFHGQIRSGPSARWMSFTGEQYNFYDRPSRLFLMDASMFGVPFQVFHRFVGPSATMRGESRIGRDDGRRERAGDGRSRDGDAVQRLVRVRAGSADRSRHSVAGDRPPDCRRIVGEV
jgi:hypothetical protein